VDYRGDAAKLFVTAVDGMNTKRHRIVGLYNNFIPIIQSSGLGKSRTIDEVARVIFTLPFVLRPREDTTGKYWFVTSHHTKIMNGAEDIHRRMMISAIS